MANVNTISLVVSTKGADKASADIGSIGNACKQISAPIKSLAMDIIYLTGAYKAFQALISIPLKGLQFQREMETAKLGIGSIIAATHELIAQDGRRLEGMEKFNAAQAVARDFMKEIQIAGLETVATTEQLVTGFQTLLGPASSAGLTMSQTKDITIQIVQAMGALGIQTNQLSAEGRSLLDGTINPMQDRLAVVLGISSDMVKKWKENGELFERLSEKLEPFKLAGGALAETWEGLFSNMKEAIAFIGGQMTSGVFEQVKAGWKSIIDMLIDTKKFDVGGGIKNLLAGAKTIADDFGAALRGAMEGFVSLLQRANDYIGKNKDKFGEVYVSVKDIAGQLLETIKLTAGLLLSVAKISLETGLIAGSLKIINLTIAAINDVFSYFVLGVKTVALALTNTVLSPLQAIMELLGRGANFVKEGWGNALLHAANNYRSAVVAVGESWEKTAMKYKDGLSPYTRKALSDQQGMEQSLKNQNTELDKFLGSMQSLIKGTDDAAGKTKKLADQWAKVQSQLQLDIAKAGESDHMQKLIDLMWKAADLRKQFGDRPIIQKWFDTNAVVVVGEAWEETAMKYKDGLSPYTRKALSDQHNIEQSLKNQNTDLDKFLGSMQSLLKGTDQAVDKTKKLAEQWAKTESQLQLDIVKSGETEYMQKMLDLIWKAADLRKQFGDRPIIQKWFDTEKMKIEQEQIKKMYEGTMDDAVEMFKKVSEAQSWLSNRTKQLTLNEYEYKRVKLLEEYEKRAEILGWTAELYRAFQMELTKIDDEESEKRLAKLAEIKQRELDMQRQNYEQIWKQAFEMVNLTGGELGKGMGMMLGGYKGLMDISAGKDEWTQRRDMLMQQWAERINIEFEGNMELAKQHQDYQTFLTNLEHTNQMQRLQTFQSMAGMMAGISYSMYATLGKQGMAFFRLYQAFAIGEAIISTYAGAARALKDFKYPYSIAVAGMVIAAGMARVRAIAAQKPGGAATGAGISGGGGYKYTTPQAQPQAPSWQKEEEKPQSRSQVINVHVYGNIVDHDAFARELVPAIQKAASDNVR